MDLNHPSLPVLLGTAAASFAVGYAAAQYFPSARAAPAAIVEIKEKPAVPASTPSQVPTKQEPVKQKAKRTAADVQAAEEAEENSLEDGDLPDEVELKMVVLVRSDLNMSKGKIAAQVGHAVLGAYRVATRLVPEYCKAWIFRAQAKITLKVEDEAMMDGVAAAARDAGLPVCVIEDAGRTEVEPGTRTVCGIGPAPKAEIDVITGPKGKFPLRLLT